MKHFPSLLLLVLGGGSLLAAAEQPKRVAMREVATHDQIVEAARKAKENAPPPLFKPAEGEDPSVKNRPLGILSRSDILCYMGKAALVPKRAVLHVPKEISDRLGMKEGAKLGSWADFALANRAWIRTVAVSRAQAEGRELIDEATLKSFEKEMRIVVATYQEGPISVTPLRTPPPEASAIPGATVPQKPAVTTVTP